MLICLSFHSDLIIPVRSGHKTCTSRPMPKGRPGDRFRVGMAEYELINVQPCPLGLVASLLYVPEGFAGPDQFIEFWTSIYGRYDPGLLVYVHWWRPCEWTG